MNTFIIEDCISESYVEIVLLSEEVKIFTEFEFVLPEYSYIEVSTHEANAPPKELYF